MFSTFSVTSSTKGEDIPVCHGRIKIANSRSSVASCDALSISASSFLVELFSTHSH